MFHTGYMRTHAEIDLRSLAMAKAIVDKLESSDWRAGVMRAREINRRWRHVCDSRLHEEWTEILASEDWPSIRSVLLDASEKGKELRQNNPFCGILTPRERWTIYREFRHAA